MDQVMAGLQPDQAYHWRLRTTSASPYFPGSPWMTLPGREDSQVHFRTRPASCSVSYVPAGNGLGGTGLFVPVLAGGGTACTIGGYGWNVTSGLGGAFGVMVIGLNPLSLPLFGGTLYATPDSIALIQLSGTPGMAGVGTYSGSLGVDLYPFVGVPIYLQAGLFDTGAVQGFALTNGLRLTINP
jgi:hypothetical protein